MKRRLLFSPAFPPSIGGIQNYMLSRSLAAPEGLEVIASKFGGWEEFDKRQNFVVHRFSYPWLHPKVGVFRRILQLWRSAQILNRVLKQKNFDVVETMPVFPGAVVAQRLRKRRNFLLVSFVAGDDMLRPLVTWYSARVFRKTLQSVDLFVAISNFTKQLLVKNSCREEQVIIIAPPIDRKRFGKMGNGVSIKATLPPHNLVLLTICRLVEKKGIDRVIEILPNLKKRFPGLIYLVGGSGEDLPRLKMLAHRCGVVDCVIFLGKVPDEKLVDTYASCDVFVMPTRFVPAKGEVEGFGISYLEASSQGKPVIGPNKGGTGDAIIHGLTGFRVDPNNIEELEFRIVQLLSDPTLRQKMGQAGRNFALKPTDWSPLLNFG